MSKSTKYSIEYEAAGVSQEKRQDTEQSEKFIKKARELGCDENGEAFERAFKKIVPPKRPKRDAGEKPEKKKPGQ